MIFKPGCKVIYTGRLHHVMDTFTFNLIIKNLEIGKIYTIKSISGIDPIDFCRLEEPDKHGCSNEWMYPCEIFTVEVGSYYKLK